MSRSVRFKSVEKCEWVQTGPSIGDGYNDCYNVSVPLRDWEINPENINTSYKQGGNVPELQMEIQFPELSEWKPSQYRNVYFEISVMYQGNTTEWLDFRDAKLRGFEFTEKNIVSASPEVIFKNLSLLSSGTYTATVVIKAFEKSGSQKVFIENSPVVTARLNIQGVATTPSTPPVINTEYRTRNITYNKRTQNLTGDLPIVINDISSFDDAENELFFNTELRKSSNQSTITLSPSVILRGYTPGIVNTYLRLTKTIGLLRKKSVFKDIPIILNIIDDGISISDFSVAPTDFSFSVSKFAQENREGSATIYNPGRLNIQIKVFPSFLENVRIESEELKFQTKNSSTLSVGNYSGEIILSSGNKEHRVNIELKVIQSLKSDFKDSAYHFALDEKKVSISRTNPLAAYVIMRLEMYYKGYGEEYRENQEYSQHYFQDEISFYPGEEVQDFFIKCKKLPSIESFEYQYNIAVVNIIIKEFDKEDRELSESRINNVLFAPGKKPKCFPIFTDFGKRRTYSDSKIRLNTDILSEKSILNKLFEKYTTDKPTFDKKFEIYSYVFERNLFNKSEEKKVLLAGNLEFVPFPNPDKTAHIFFENQNLVLDWFSCPIEHRRKFDFTHIIDENTGEKYGALESEELILNTGWILKEEIELVNALIKSRICFILLEGKIITARAMSKKNEMYDSINNLYSMDLEFNIKHNER